MQDKDIMLLWQDLGSRHGEKALTTEQVMGRVTMMKTGNLLRSMMPVKLFTVGIGILWCLVMGGVVASVVMRDGTDANYFFVVSMGLQVLITAIAIGIYLYQMSLLQGLDMEGPVVDTQARISSLVLSTLGVTRILFLQLPLWTTFFLHKATLEQASTPMLIVQGLTTSVFVGIAIWLFVQIRYENRNKRWFRLLFRGREWDPLMQAMETLEEADAFRK